MDVKFVNPFINAITTVLPQLGFLTITRGKLSTREKAMPSLGVTVLVGFTKSVRGNVAYNMTTEAACKIASTMMMGMPVATFDEMAQSAISELSNMVTANAATNLASMDFEVDISTPSLTLGDNFSVKISDIQYLVIEMDIDGNLIEINMDLH
ncbi:chemotaxis protein CheX [Propionispira arboris]|uniref:Chemotaxis protein CheX n=1 Tax=Propionispira arboris TaxID=84035 RepID=A0A1H6W5K4_9FIRM|nr:chemotaxis protein CheX [Propionispira arboris]SEJ10504.1 chemotaxis protein CheX [Propionispira arboris]